MRARKLFPALLLLACIPGCVDGQLDTSPSATIILDVAPLLHHTADGAQVVCATVAQEAVLRVDNRRRASLPITREVSSLVFEDVEVRPGRVQFDVEIRSSTNALLYAGGQTVEVEVEPFQVAVSLERENGVLRVCPAMQLGVRSVGWLEFTNVGDRPITVDLPQPPSSCSGPCFTYGQSPTRFAVDPDDEVSVNIFVSELASGPYTLRIDSSVGYTEVEIHVN
jgi:hypothetical protein